MACTQFAQHQPVPFTRAEGGQGRGGGGASHRSQVLHAHQALRYWTASQLSRHSTHTHVDIHITATITRQKVNEHQEPLQGSEMIGQRRSSEAAVTDCMLRWREATRGQESGTAWAWLAGDEVGEKN